MFFVLCLLTNFVYSPNNNSTPEFWKKYLNMMMRRTETIMLQGYLETDQLTIVFVEKRFAKFSVVVFLKKVLISGKFLTLFTSQQLRLLNQIPQLNSYSIHETLSKVFSLTKPQFSYLQSGYNNFIYVTGLLY